MSKRISLILIIVITALSVLSCGDPPAADSTEKITQPATAAVTEAQTEAQTEEPEPEFDSGEAKINEDFAFTKRFAEKETAVKTAATETLGGKKYEITYESVFYGPSSMVDRDSHHMGDLYTGSVCARNYPEASGYVYGDFNGDRYGEYVIYKNGEIRIYIGKSKNKYDDSRLIYSQKFDFDGVIRGTGDFDGNGFTDLLFVSDGLYAVIGYGSNSGFAFKLAGKLKSSVGFSPENVFAGDINGDCVTDIIAVNGFDTVSWLIAGGVPEIYAEKQLNIKDEYGVCCTSDVNSDNLCDLIVCINGHDLRTYYGRRDGQFGPYEDEIGNENLYPTWEGNIAPTYMTCGDINCDGVDDIVATSTLGKKTDVNLVLLNYPTEAPAYDYSTHIIKKDDGTYILYNGGLYVDYDKDKYTPSDGDHVLVYLSDDGVHWFRNLDGPAFYLGGELGMNGEWWSGNTIEPEVVYVDGTYYMYWQCENYTHLEDGTLIGHDSIGVATSKDGLHFERKTDAPVIINIPEYASFDHEEVVYFPDDPDGKCFWMYVRMVIRNTEVRSIRIRTADPLSFDCAEAEAVNGLWQLGNQIGWLRLDNGEALFCRTTFIDYRNSAVPAVQFSADGLGWRGPIMRLAGVDPDDPAAGTGKNCYFPGFSTINGTGEIERLPDGRYRFVYGACTSNTPVAPAIFYSSVGCGECVFEIKEK